MRSTIKVLVLLSILGTMHVVSNEIVKNFPELLELMKKSDYGMFEWTKDGVGSKQKWSPDLIQADPPLDSIFTSTEHTVVDSFFSDSPFGSIRHHNNDASLLGMLQVALMLKENGNKQNIPFDFYLELVMDSLKKATFQLDEYGDSSLQSFSKRHRNIAQAIVGIVQSSKEQLERGNGYDIPLYKKSLTSDMRLDVPDTLTTEVTVKRNLLWLPKIISKIKEGSGFIAVGLGHLEYNTGLIQLLRKQGYTLKPVKLKKASS